MRHLTLPAAVMVVAGLTSLSASAQQAATQSYRGVVTLVGGEQSDAVEVGEPITVSYTVDPAVADVDPNPQAGRFPAALVQLTVQLPESGLAVSGDAGQIQTFDNTANPDDQVSFFTSNIVSPGELQGLPVLALELGFIGSTDMLASDALPLHRLEGQGAVLIATERGWTDVLFTVTADPTVPELVEDGILRLQAALAAGTVAPGPGNALIDKLQRLQRNFGAARAQRSCSALTAFEAQLRGMTNARLVDASLAQELQTLARELALALGQC